MVTPPPPSTCTPQLLGETERNRLLASLDTFEALFDVIDMPVWLRDPEGKLLWVNNAYTRAVEGEDRQAVLTRGLELLGTAARERVRAAVTPERPFLDKVSTVIHGHRRFLEVADVKTPSGNAGLALDVSIEEDLREELRRTIQSHAETLDHLATLFEDRVLPESLETLLSLLIELVPDTADQLAAGIGGKDELTLQACRTVGELQTIIDVEYQWALDLDMDGPEARAYVWYKSETAEEPRRGPRSEVPGALDLGLDLPGGGRKLKADLDGFDEAAFLSRFLLMHPEHRYLVGRLQSLAGEPYHSPIANINAADFVPIELVRLMNVTVHGIDKTRDFLNRNLRGVLFHGAPTTDDIRAGKGEFWYYPEEPAP